MVLEVEMRADWRRMCGVAVFTVILLFVSVASAQQTPLATTLAESVTVGSAQTGPTGLANGPTGTAAGPTLSTVTPAPPATTPAASGAPLSPGVPGHHFHHPHHGDRWIWGGRRDDDAPTMISCSQDGRQIIWVTNAYDVEVVSSGAWPIINFRKGFAGPTRSIGLNSPTLQCETRFGVTQGGAYRQTGVTSGADVYTLTCFRKGAIIVQQRVTHLEMSWSYNTMTMNYHLRDGRETASSASYDVTTTACLSEPSSQELVQITTDLQ
jgi:hypothetical protein